MLSAANEYEVLQLLLGECRERLAAYAGAQHPLLFFFRIVLVHTSMVVLHASVCASSPHSASYGAF